MTSKTIKTVLFVALMLSMVIPIASMHVAAAQTIKERDFVAEWQVIQKEIDVLAEKQIDAQDRISRTTSIAEVLQLEQEIEKHALEINALNKKIDDLEQESINSLKMDTNLEKKLLAAELDITQKYANANSSQSIGENPVWGAYVDYELQKVVVFIDSKYNESSKITRTITEQYGADIIHVNNEIPQLTACSSQTSTCSPLIGGIAISRNYDPGTLAGTLGYKARDSSGNTGFVTAGHVVDFWNNGNTWMRQPVSGSLVGFATIEQQGNSNLDFAFVKTTVSINDDIFQSSNKVMDVTSYASSSDHTAGTFLYMQGVSSGELSGTITGTSSTGWFVTNMNPITGDSGAPVYKKFAGAHGTFTVKIYGHMYNNAGIYGSVHGVTSMYGVTPLTT